MRLAVVANYTLELTAQEHAIVLQALRYQFEAMGDEATHRLLAEIGNGATSDAAPSAAPPAAVPSTEAQAVRQQTHAEAAFLQGATVKVEGPGGIVQYLADPSAEAAALQAQGGSDPARDAEARRKAEAVAALGNPILPSWAPPKVMCESCHDTFTQEEFEGHSHPAPPRRTKKGKGV